MYAPAIVWNKLESWGIHTFSQGIAAMIHVQRELLPVPIFLVTSTELFGVAFQSDYCEEKKQKVACLAWEPEVAHHNVKSSWRNW